MEVNRRPKDLSDKHYIEYLESEYDDLINGLIKWLKIDVSCCYDANDVVRRCQEAASDLFTLEREVNIIADEFIMTNYSNMKKSDTRIVRDAFKRGIRDAARILLESAN